VIRSKRAIVALLTGLNLLNYLDRFLVNAVGPRFQTEFGLSDAELGFAVSSFMIGYMLTSPIFGWLGDRGPRKRLIAAGIAVWSAATVLSGLARGLVSMLAARVIVGVGEASYATLGPTIIDDLAGKGSKNRLLALFFVATPVGAALGYVLGGALEPRLGWRSVFFLGGGPGLLLAGLALLIAEPARARSPAGVATTPAGVYLALFRDARFRRTVIGYVAQTFALGGFTTWAAPFLYRRLCFQLSDGSQIFGYVTAVTGLVGTAVGGFAADRIPGADRTRIAIQVCAWSSVIAAPAALAALLAPTPMWFFVGLALAELAIFASVSPINAAALGAAPPEARVSAMAALVFAIHMFGDLLSPPLIGAISDGLDDAKGHCTGGRGLLAGMYLLPIALALSAALWFRASAAPPAAAPQLPR
jgi:MFS transporter, Spinster family, sphingosine-1-phosphate transporter